MGWFNDFKNRCPLTGLNLSDKLSEKNLIVQSLLLLSKADAESPARITSGIHSLDNPVQIKKVLCDDSNRLQNLVVGLRFPTV